MHRSGIVSKSLAFTGGSAKLALHLNEVSVRYGKFTALDSVSLTAETGVLGIAGINGSGKSTLLGVCARSIRPDTGDLVTMRDDVVLAGRSMSVGVLPQNFAFPKRISVRDLVRFSAWVRGFAKTCDELTDAALRSTGLTEFADQPLGKASGGMVRRAGFAAAIVHKPDLLILDEPTTGVDPEQRLIMRELIRQHSTERIVVMSSHIAEDIDSLCDSFILLHQGAIVFDGSVPDALAASGRDSLEEAIISIPKLAK